MSGLSSRIETALSSSVEPKESSGEGNWVVIERKEIPEEQQIATDKDLRAGIAQLESGFSAHTAFTDQCPIQIGGGPGERTVYYTVTFYVHRSEDVTPEIEVTLNGEQLEIKGPTPGLIPKEKSWVFEKNKTQQLGWRAQEGSFKYGWEIAFDDQANKIPPGSPDLPEVEHDDGIAYIIGDAVTGSVRLSGNADCEVYTCRIGQRIGTKWQGGLYTTAWWPAGYDREDQQSVTEEMFLPSCVVEKIEECSDTIEDFLTQGIDPFQAAESGESPVLILNPTVSLDVDDCSGEVFGKTPNTE
jgi:hypothetical protein